MTRSRRENISGAVVDKLEGSDSQAPWDSIGVEYEVLDGLKRQEHIRHTMIQALSDSRLEVPTVDQAVIYSRHEYGKVFFEREGWAEEKRREETCRRYKGRAEEGVERGDRSGPDSITCLPLLLRPGVSWFGLAGRKALDATCAASLAAV